MRAIGDAHSHPGADPYGNRHAGTYAYASPHCDANGDPGAYSHPGSPTNSYPHSQAGRDPITHAHAYTYADTSSDGYPDSQAYRYRDAHSHSYPGACGAAAAGWEPEDAHLARPDHVGPGPHRLRRRSDSGRRRL